MTDPHSFVVARLFAGNHKLDLGSEFHHVFWMGDLNYRINIKSVPGYAATADDREVEWSAVVGLVRQLDDGNAQVCAKPRP